MDRKEAIKKVMEENPELDPVHELDKLEILAEAERVTGEEYTVTDTAEIDMREIKQSPQATILQIQNIRENVKLISTIANQLITQLEEIEENVKQQI